MGTDTSFFKATYFTSAEHDMIWGLDWTSSRGPSQSWAGPATETNKFSAYFSILLLSFTFETAVTETAPHR